MDIINNRYRVLKFIKQNKVVSSYLVQDLNLQKKIMLNIINYERVPKALMDYYIEEFITWINIESPTINRVYDFGVINLIDNKKFNEVKYYYTSDYYGDKTIKDVNHNIDTEDNILEVFVQLCEGINYFHMKGFTYNELNLNNICVSENDYNKEIKLKDIPTVNLDKVCHSGKSEVIGNFKDGNNIDNSISFDIYSLGVMLFYLCLTTYIPFNENVFNREDVFLKPNLSQEFIDKIELIIKKCTSNISSYSCIGEIVDHINNIFNKNYKLQNIEEIKKIQFNLKLIGRNEEISTVMNEYNSILSDISTDKIIMVHGDTGIGKTKFLMTVSNLLTFNKANVYANFSTGKRLGQSFKEILKQIVAEAEPNIVSKYEEDLAKFIPEFHLSKNIIHNNDLTIPKERLKLLNRVQGFINDFTKYKPMVIILDDIHLADEFSIQLLEYFCTRQVKNKSILIIVSYCDGKHVLNKNTLEFIENIKFRNNVRNIYLKGLDEEKTGEMIKNILSMHEVPKEFAKVICSKSYGNPLFIEEVIKDFYSKGIIYPDKKLGIWATDYEYHEFPIPSDINEILINQIQDIGDMSYEILSIISTFLTPVSVESIQFMTGYSRENIENRIDIMMGKGLICKKIGDEGFVYDLYNKLLKDLIYGKIHEKERRSKHKLAAEFLENQYVLGHEEYIEELIYHLEKAGQKEKVIDYCFENAKKMKKLNNHIESIKNLKKAIEVVQETNFIEKKIELMTEISVIYEEVGDFNEALTYFTELEGISGQINDNKIKLYCLNKKCNIYCQKNNIKEAKKCVQKVAKIIENTKKLEDFLNYKVMEVRVCNLKGEYSKAYKICMEGLNMCTDEYKDYKAILYNSLCFICITTSKIDEAEEAVRNSIKIFTETNNYKGLVKSFNNMGVIYGDYYQDIEKASEIYLKTRDICIKNNLIVSEMVAENNLGEGHFYQNNYIKALTCFEDIENKCKKYQLDICLLYAYNFLSMIHLRTSNYHKAYEYYKLASEEMDIHPIYNKDILEYYRACIEMNLEFGNLEKAREFIQKSLSFCNNDRSLLQSINEFLLEYMELFTSSKDKVPEIINNAIRILDGIKNLNIKIELLCKIGVFSYKHGFYNKGKEVLLEIRNLITKSVNLNNLAVEVMHLEALYDENNKIQSLTNVLELAKKQGNKKLEGSIYKDIGRCYFYMKDYFNSFVYYFECCEVLIDLIKPLPKKIRESFVKFYNLKDILNRLIDIKEYYCRESNWHSKKNVYADIDVAEITNLLSFIDCKDIMNNKYFMRSVKNFYSSLLHCEIHDIKDVLSNITSNDVENLNTILRYMLYLTMGTDGCIIDEFDEGLQQVICAYSCSVLTEEDIAIIKKCKYAKEPILISNLENYEKVKKENFKNIKACICIPILSNSNVNKTVEKDNRINAYDETTVLAYIYIRSERALNNFNSRTLKKCLQLNGLLTVIMEKYRLNKIAAYDKLTGTLTRKYLEEEIEKNIDVAAENNGRFSMVMFDLDHFKNINDKFGHQTGDEVLREVCRIAKNSIRSTDICGRYGGEEFIILLKNSNVDDAYRIAEKIRTNIEETKILGDKAKVTASMGIVSYPKHGQWKQQLIEKVDQALYEAKEKGRNQCKVWSEDTSSKLKGTNKLTGVITENEVQNNRNVLVMVELIEIINAKMEYSEKIYKILGRIIEITESQYGTLFLVKDEKVTESFSRKAFSEEWIKNVNYNHNILQDVLEKKLGIYTIDWDNIIQKDPITRATDWHSITVVPMVKNDIVKGALYLSTSVKLKEFGVEEFNYVNTLAKIITTMM